MDNLAKLKQRAEFLGGEPLPNFILEEALESAKLAILARRYPSQNYPKSADGDYELPEQYENLQYRMAVEIISKLGAEGQIHHTENQINRQYETGFISKHLLNEVVPLVKVIKKNVYTE